MGADVGADVPFVGADVGADVGPGVGADVGEDVGVVGWTAALGGAAIGVNCSHMSVSCGEATTTATISTVALRLSRIVSQVTSNELGLLQSSRSIAICSASTP